MKRFKNILYVIKAAVDQDSTLARAVSLAENNTASLTIMEVISSKAANRRPETIAHHVRSLETLIESYRERLPIHLEVRPGKVFLEVIRAVMRDGYDLVIKAADNPTFLKRLFGGDDMHLLRKCPCPFWLMKPPERSNYTCILAAVDFNPLQYLPEEHVLNEEIVELASSLALSDFAALHLVHVWQAFGERSVRGRGDDTGKNISSYVDQEQTLHQNGLRLLGNKLRDKIGADTYDYLSPRLHVLKGSVQKQIPALAKEVRADVVVMGTVAWTGVLGLLLGSTAEKILDDLPCSVLAVKPSDFVSPVKLRKR